MQDNGTLALLLWWFALQALGLIALPITTLVFGRFPLRGYAFSKAIGLLVVGYGGWLLSMLGILQFTGAGLALVGLFILIGGCWALGSERCLDLITFLRARWRAVLAYETLFAAALLVGLWLRWNGATGGAIFGTEKPMDLAFLSGILNSPRLPPRDPWLAGYAINYYYLGYLFVAALALLTNVSLGAAFNLGLASTFALTALMVAGLVMALVRHAPLPGGERRTWSGAGAAALLGVVLVLILGNQAGALQSVVGSHQAVALDGGQLVSAVTQRLSGDATLKLDPPLRTSDGDFGVVSQLTPGSGEGFNWWWPSRAIWDDVELSPGVTGRHYAITEFPFFSFYLGDLHPHVLALPFDLLAIALALATLTQPRPHTLRGDTRARLSLAVTALILGCLYIINSWDAPTYALLFAGALLLRHRRGAVHAPTSQVLWAALRELATLGLVAALMISPFLLTFRSFAGGGSLEEPWSKIPLLSTLGRTLGLAPDHTDLWEFITMLGLPVAILLFYAASAFAGRRVGAESDGELGERWTWVWIVGTLLIGLVIGMPLLALLPLALVCWRAAWNETDQPAQTFVLWVTAVGALVVLASDIVYLRDPFENRMNTIFKFYYQAWVLWGSVAAFAAWAFWRRARGRPLLRAAWSLPVLLLGLGALVYPVNTLRWGQAWASGQAQIDGLAHLRRSAPDEAAALEWIAAHTQRDDIVLTAVGSSYDGSTGWVAAVTGRPTLLGWSGSHQRLWRGSSPDALAEIAARERDIPTIYTTPDPAIAQELLDRYSVRYLYVGPTERRLYGGPGLDKFDTFLQLVFQGGNIRIYRVP